MTGEPGFEIRTCDDALARVYDLLGEHLDADVQVRVSEHFEACGHCGEILQFERRLRVSLRERTAETVPDRLRHEILRRLDELGGGGR